MALHWFHLPAAVGAAAHAYFGYIETFDWTPVRVKAIAPSWFEGLTAATADNNVAWAQDLAFNIGVYNFMLALGLAWILIADPRLGRRLAIFFAIWHLSAAAAAYYTGVMPAFYVQGSLGLLLLAAAIGLHSAVRTSRLRRYLGLPQGGPGLTPS